MTLGKRLEQAINIYANNIYAQNVNNIDTSISNITCMKNKYTGTMIYGAVGELLKFIITDLRYSITKNN